MQAQPSAQSCSKQQSRRCTAAAQRAQRRDPPKLPRGCPPVPLPSRRCMRVARRQPSDMSACRLPWFYPPARWDSIPLHHLRAVHALRCKLHTAHLYIMQAFTRSWVAKLPQPVRIHAMQFEAQAICLITPQIAITYACAGWRKCLSAGSPGAGAAAAAAAASAAH